VKALIDENPNFILNVTYAYLKKNTKIYVDTEIANFVMPGISKMYGSGIPMDVVFSVKEFRGIHSDDKGILSAYATLNAKFLVEQKNAAPICAADIEIINAHAHVNITLKEEDQLNIEVIGFNFTEVEANMVTFGYLYN